jgi:hypothetical protein
MVSVAYRPPRSNRHSPALQTGFPVGAHEGSGVAHPAALKPLQGPWLACSMRARRSAAPRLESGAKQPRAQSLAWLSATQSPSRSHEVAGSPLPMSSAR